MKVRTGLYFLWFLFSFTLPEFAQTEGDALLIARLQQPIDFTVTGQRLIYAITGTTNEVLKLDERGTILKQTGGFGWDSGLFDGPSAVCSNIISVFVTDKNNHRVQQFDKDLNYVGALQTSSPDQPNAVEIRYPVDCQLSAQGDYFILDSENKRIVKFDPFGKYLMDFGGVNWGAFALQAPLRFIGGNNDGVAVLEQERIVFYSPFGTGLQTLPLKSEIHSAALHDGSLYLAGGSTITRVSLDGKADQPETRELQLDGQIVKIEIKNDALYILTTTGIYRTAL
jgi:hypothetical protein